VIHALATEAMTKLSALLAWRQRLLPNGLNGSESSFAKQLANHLSVENVEKAGIKVPKQLYEVLVAFRHLRQDARVAAISRALDGKPVASKKKSTIIAVCGYVSQEFESVTDAKEWVRYRLERALYPRGFVVEGKVTAIEKNFKQPLKGRNDGQEQRRKPNGRSIQRRPQRASPPG